MICYIVAITAIALIIGLVWSLSFGINASVHKDMTVGACSEWDYSSYKWFRVNFARHNWKVDYNYKSVFDYHTDSQCHASIIKFNGKGMVLGPLDFALSQWYLKKYTKKSTSPGLWKEGYRGPSTLAIVRDITTGSQPAKESK